MPCPGAAAASASSAEYELSRGSALRHPVPGHRLQRTGPHPADACRTEVRRRTGSRSARITTTTATCRRAPESLRDHPGLAHAAPGSRLAAMVRRAPDDLRPARHPPLPPPPRTAG